MLSKTKQLAINISSRTVYKHPYIIAATIYLLLDSVIYGYKPIWFGINHHCVGWAYNFNYFVWIIGWWKFSLLHGLNPFWTNYIWAGTGVGLSWNAFLLPSYGIISIPFTYILNPVEIANIILMLQPLLAAISAFALTKEVTHNFSGSLIGGYLFGFSSYMTEEVVQSLPNNMTIFTIPLLALIILKYLRSEIGWKKLYFFSSLILIFQAGTFLEIFLSLTIFTFLSFFILFLYSHKYNDFTKKLITCAGTIFASYVTTAIVISPLLYDMLVNHFYKGGKFGFFGISLASIIIPSKFNLFGYNQSAWPKHWNSGPWSSTAYIGIPILLLVSYFLFSKRYNKYNQIKIFLITALILSLGRNLYFYPPTHDIGSALMPWYITKFIPIIKDAQPHRFFVYFDIITSIIIALYWRDDKYTLRRNLLVGLACISILPTRHLLSQDIYPAPDIFRNNNYASIIKNGQNVLIVSREFLSDAMKYQAEDKFYYKITQGNNEGPGTVPAYKYFNSINNHSLQHIGKFISAHDVKAIIFVDQDGQAKKVKKYCYREEKRYKSIICYTSPVAAQK